MSIKLFTWTICESLGVLVPPFHVYSDVSVTHELYFLCHIVYHFRRWIDWVYVTFKCFKLMKSKTFPIPCKLRWSVVECTIYFSSIYFSWCFWCTKTFFTLITIKKTWSNHVVHVYVMALIFSVDSQGITNSSFNGYTELINKKVSYK